MNSSTGGTTIDGNNWGIVKEAKNALGGETTSHNCYGVGTQYCADNNLLENKQPMNWEPAYQPVQKDGEAINE